MANLFLVPQYILTGEGALESGGNYLKDFGKRALLVTDSIMVKLGNVDKVISVLNQFGITYVIYDEINSEPSDDMIRKGVSIYKKENCDFLIAIGGGSPIDSMKAIGASIAYDLDICNFIGKSITKQLPPACAIPTTAGTGSEATQFTIITDTKNQVKMLLKGPALMAKLAIVDPMFTLTAPKGVTSSTGIDALTHAIEAYTSSKSTSMSDIFAVSAIKRIFHSLLETYTNPSNVEARKEMAIAALEAGISFNNSSVTIVHGMSRPIGALYHIAHGLSNAMLLDKCLSFILTGAQEKLCNLAKEIDCYDAGMTDKEGADSFVKAVSALCQKLEIQTLAQFGVDKNNFMNHIPKMTTDALESGSPSNTRHIPTQEDIAAIYKSLWD